MRQSNFVRKIQPILIILCEWLWETSLPKFKIKIEVSQRFCYRSNNRIQSQFYLIRIWQFSIKQKLYINIVRFHANRSVDINALYTNNTNHQFHLLEHRAAKISTKSLEAVRRKQKLGRKKKYIIKSIWKPSVLSLSVSKSWFSFFWFHPTLGLDTLHDAICCYHTSISINIYNRFWPVSSFCSLYRWPYAGFKATHKQQKHQISYCEFL